MAKLLKEGYLYKAHPRDGLFNVTVFQKRYFVLWSSGTLEYYTSYQKQPEEYCSTLNMKETLDILAPISVGKKHNIIKLSIKKKDREKEYWFDCDCPSLMNEWLNCMISVAGLSAEDEEDCFDQGTAPIDMNSSSTSSSSKFNNNNRRLPSLPMIMDMEYEVPQKNEEFYEEISPVGSPEINNNKCSLPYKYIPNMSNDNNGLLKRAPIISSSKSSTPSPTGIMTTSPIPINTSPTPVPINDPELIKRLSFRRHEVYDSTNFVSDEDTYESVLFTTEITVGERSHSKVNMRAKVKNNSNNNVIKPNSDNKPIKTARNNSPSHETQPTPPPRDSVLFDLPVDDEPLLPPIPPRSHSYGSDLNSVPLYMSRDSSPPPVPQRNRKGTKTDQNGCSYSSTESSDQSGDGTIIKGINSHNPGSSLLATVIGNTPIIKPVPQTVKPKLHPPPIAKKPKALNNKPAPPLTRPKPIKGPPTIAPKNRSASDVQHSPVIPPKAVILPTRSGLQSNCSILPKSSPKISPKQSNTGLPPKPSVKHLPPKPTGTNLPPKPTGTNLPPKPKNFAKESFKRPPMPLPK